MGVVVGKGAAIQTEGDCPALTGGQRHLEEGAQLTGRAEYPIGGGRNIELDDLLAGHIAGVGHGHANGQTIVFTDFGRGELHIGIGKACIAQAVAEGVGHFLAGLVVIAVAHIDALPVLHIALVSKEAMAGRVLQRQGPGLSKMTAGRRFSQQQIQNRAAAVLPAKIHQQYAVYLLPPGQQHRRAGAEYHDKRRSGPDQRGHQQCLIFGQVHMGPVEALALKAVGQAQHNHCHVGFPGSLDRLTGQRLVRLALGGKALGVGIFDFSLVQRVAEAGDPGGIDFAGACTLIPGVFGKVADHGELCTLLQGQRRAFAQQHGALPGHLPGQLMMDCLVVGGDGILGYAQGKLRHPDGAGVHLGLGQTALPDSLNDQRVVSVAGAGHFQVKSCLDGLHPVVHGAPVGHDGALKAPFTPGYVGHQPFVVRGVDAVDHIVRAHQRPGLGLLHRRFIAGQIDLPQGALVHNRAGADTGPLLVVGKIMLHAGTHVPALDPLDQPCGNLAGEQGILRKVFKISSAQGAALDVGRGPQNNADFFRPAFIAHSLSHPLHQLRIKAARGGRCRREAGSGNGLIQSQMVRFSRLFSQPVGTVGEHEGADAQPLHCLALPEIFPGAQRGLFLQRHLRHKLPGLLL